MKTIILIFYFVLVIFPNSINAWKIEEFVNFRNDGPWASVYGTDLGTESLTICSNGNMYATRFLHGTIYKINQFGSVSTYAQFPERTGLRLTGIVCDEDNHLYVSLHDIDPSTNQTTLYNGVWRVNGGSCDLGFSYNCEKLFPLDEEPVFYPDGLEIDDEEGLLYVSDPAYGNIWVIDIIDDYYNNDDDNDNYNAELWAGTDEGSKINYLAGLGIFGAPGTEFNPAGEGFGVNGLSLDKDDKKTLYTVNSEAGLIVEIPIKRDGSAKKQILLYNQTLSAIYDAILVTSDRIYVTVVGRINPTNFQLESGQQILSAFLDDPFNFQEFIYDPLIGTPTDIIQGCNFGHSNSFYVSDLNLLGLTTGPRILKISW